MLCWSPLRRAEREPPFELPAAAHKHANAAPAGPRSCGVEQRGLADPGSALDKQRASASIPRRPDERLDLPKLELALDERRREPYRVCGAWQDRVEV